jgi:hypothetical protein
MEEERRRRGGSDYSSKERRGDASSRGEICKKFSTTTKSCPVFNIIHSFISDLGRGVISVLAGSLEKKPHYRFLQRTR